jgi:hypothetical protein
MSRWAQPTAFNARFRADRWPYRRAQKRLTTFTMSRTRSSATPGIEHHQPPAVRQERGPDQFGIHPPEPVAVLDHHRGHLRSASSLRTFAPDPFISLGLQPHYPAARVRGPGGQPRHLPVQALSLVMGRYPYTSYAATAGPAGASGRPAPSARSPAAPGPATSLPEPLVRGLRMHTLARAHSVRFTPPVYKTRTCVRSLLINISAIVQTSTRSLQDHEGPSSSQ